MLEKLTLYVEESPTAAQVLDLDAESGMRSETVKGDSLAWKKLLLFLIELCLENRFVFDFIKYETLRAEIDYMTKLGVNREYAWVLWEGKNQPPDLRRLGCLSGIMNEGVVQGSIRRGMLKSEGDQIPQWDDN